MLEEKSNMEKNHIGISQQELNETLRSLYNFYLVAEIPEEKRVYRDSICYLWQRGQFLGLGNIPPEIEKVVEELWNIDNNRTR